ncbi:class I adenylate-forming enzyme family protein [Amycolatopsis sp. GM8]|uniref:class I adenylate-forming enzyme family protein n=1 Tax=Amycolatopsis sp. GM8 TaxID=2896530 RepID=UPI001F3DF68A|nr:class I adenylate-forming enzyme family protein [Amycolatopsis sp. GM8]
MITGESRAVGDRHRYAGIGDETLVRQRVTADLTAPGTPFEIRVAEVLGRRCRIYANAPGTLRDVYAKGAQWHRKPAITFEGETHTWDEYLAIVARFGRALVERFGVRKGDRVALAMRNYPEWPFVFAAAVSVGAVCVPLNSWWSGRELGYALADCDAKVFIGDRERVELVQGIRADLPGLETVVEVRPGEVVRGDVEWQQLLADVPEGLDLSAVSLDADDDCTIMYTSGTTGRPKGAITTHRAHVANLYNLLVQGAIDAELDAWRGEPAAAPPEAPAALVPGPLFHVANLPKLYLAAISGRHLVFMYKWDARRAIEIIDGLDVDGFSGVPTVIRQLLDTVEADGSTLPSLRLIGMGGAPTPASQIERIKTLFDGRVAVSTGYGLTETTGGMIGISSHDFFARPLAVGLPYPTSEVRIVGEDGADVGAGELGEAWFKGPTVARGYWNRTTESFSDGGWFHSGDIVRRDEDGFIQIVDRLKDVVIRAGENVYCSEVENVLHGHPSVWDAAVFGVPHELWGEEVVAVVHTRPDAGVTEEELRAYAAGLLAPYKIPSAIFIDTEPLPRNPTGKVLKTELRQVYADRMVR